MFDIITVFWLSALTVISIKEMCDNVDVMRICAIKIKEADIEIRKNYARIKFLEDEIERLEKKD